ncbi:DNA/pantothenate metabolism flavoprotein [Limihaloglobus sulfuriphilus]|uniref:DNA/pantothenate metabolism flavoprotein n=1 Tax=Limihaloglobus sulfuriphilus TaxID=1851148 RepID=A0A1Q2MBW7_9BACT|nr:flavoprotein [Limihaloglobus sulfuriphilus]AQQ70150.1 DNA/pantothenate metabolism flavoprotein [Limihaloglobus sulfuriphilus]
MKPDKDILKGKKILLGVTGGIAAYKSADLASKLVQAGADVTVMITKCGLELIGSKTFEALTSNPVLTTLWNSPENYAISHIQTVRQSDAIVVAPATANIIAKMAGGIGDDILSTTLIAGWQKPILLAPAMNNMMWENPIVQKNLDYIKTTLGVKTAGPCEGYLACGTKAAGRMAQPEEILTEIRSILQA